MDQEKIEKIIADYDKSHEDSLRSMLSDFYSRKMAWVAVLVWGWALLFIGGAVVFAIAFFAAEQTKDQIMYAALFVCQVQFVAFIKVFAWLMMTRNGLKREIKRLELRISELPETLANRVSQSQ